MSSPLSSYTTTTPSTSTPTSIPSRTWTPTTNAIPFHTSLTSNNGTTTNFSPARLYTLSHTTFLLSYFILRFNALVADPVRTMTEMAVPLIVAQGLWCVLCLPRSGYWDARTGGLKVEETPTAQSGKGSTKRKAGSTAAGDSIISRAVPLIFSLILTLTTLPPPILLLSILFGAPMTTHTIHTGLLSLHLSLLIGPPLFYTHGVSTAAWREIVSVFLPFDEPGVWGGTIGALIGGWLGAVPIPLDWDREWQKWPVTVLTGVWMGWAVGRTLLGPVVLRGKRIDLREVDQWEGDERGKAAESSGEVLKKRK